jgi:hypothetical protein
MNLLIGRRRPRPVSYRPIIATRLGTHASVRTSSVRWSQYSRTAQNPVSQTSAGASSHAGSIETAFW